MGVFVCAAANKIFNWQSFVRTLFGSGASCKNPKTRLINAIEHIGAFNFDSAVHY